MYAGNGTRFLNLQRNTRDDLRIRPIYHQVRGWSENGLIERVPVLPDGLKGRARGVLDASVVAMLPRPDVIWSAAAEVVVPHLWAQMGPLRRPLVLDLDSTLEQQEAMAPVYFRRPSKRGARLFVARMVERVLWSRTTLFLPWSRWAAESLHRQGVPGERICVLPPGVDLKLWSPKSTARESTTGKLRLLFVGGDFERKGGHILLDVFRRHFADRCELDIVTHSEVEASGGVHVHRAGPNSPQLRALYRRADLFALPTRAECFGIATVEAMASGLPAIVGDVGGARDIVEDGVDGWLIEPNGSALCRALERAIDQREQLPDMGRRARQAAEKRFDGSRNDARLVELLVDEAAHHTRR